MSVKSNAQPTKVRERFPWKVGSAVYVASYGLMFFFLNALFWDDWYTKMLPVELERSYWKNLGFPPPISFILIDVFRRNAIVLHLAVFFIFFICGWLLFQILQKIEMLTESDRRNIVLLFLVLPINSARVAMQMFNYSYSLLFFYLAWYLLTTKTSRWAKMASILFFVLSFQTLSFLVFLVLPAIHYLVQNQARYGKNARVTYLGPSFMLLIAPIYWITIKTVYPPKPSMRAYYSPTLSGTARGLILLLIVTGLLIWAGKRYLKVGDKRILIIAVASLIIVLGAFPYMTSGRLVDLSEWMFNFVPRASEWESRNQLLLGLGFAALLVGLFGDLDSQFKKYAFKVVIGTCVFLNFTFMQGYMLDARKQSEVINLFANSETIKSGNVIMIHDLAVRYNARGRDVRTYEWNGMLEKALGDTNHKSVNYGYIDCSNPDALIPDVLVTIDSSIGKFKSLLTNNVGINIVATKISPCLTQQ